MIENTRQLPLVALRNMTVMPGMLIHFDLNRKISILAIEEAMQNDQKVMLVSQKNAQTEKPEEKDLFSFGTIAEVKQLIKLPGNVLRVLVAGNERAKLEAVTELEPFMKANVKPLAEPDVMLSAPEAEAMLRGIRDLFNVYAGEYGKLNHDIISQVTGSEDIVKIVNQLMIHIPMTLEDTQRVLSAESFEERYETLCAVMAQEIEILRIKKDIQGKVRDKVDKNQKDYIMREQLKVIREELGETNIDSDVVEYRKKLESLTASPEVKEKISKEIDRFVNIASSSAEGAVARGYVETLLELPWDYETKDICDIKYAKCVLDEDHYGLKKVKERILECLAVRQVTEKPDATIICLVGPPGTGKTSIARSIAKALGREYVRICLGGVRDEAEIRGHRRTYVGAMPGRIIAGLKQAKSCNPLMLLDEIDKAGADQRGDTSSALLEVLDPEQNAHFTDHYVEIPVNLSKVLFIATANSTETIARPLLDRMEVIEINSYTETEKFHIAKEHLLRKEFELNGIKKGQLSITDKALYEIIEGYTREAGVRSLQRCLGELCRKSVKIFLEDDTKKKIRVSDRNLSEFLGKKKFFKEQVEKEPQVGVVCGLAWTSVGGTTLSIEVNTMPGKGALVLTGSLGDVMKESAQAGISYIRSMSEEYGIEADYFEKHDIHIHIPEGATPKDGPSAGITMATAVLSAIMREKVRAEVAMTGEITLKGRVLPIGGLKEKLLAARMAGVKKVLIPKQNKADFEEIEPEITDGLKVVYVENMSDVIPEAIFAKKPVIRNEAIK